MLYVILSKQKIYPMPWQSLCHFPYQAVNFMSGLLKLTGTMVKAQELYSNMLDDKQNN